MYIWYDTHWFEPIDKYNDNHRPKRQKMELMKMIGKMMMVLEKAHEFWLELSSQWVLLMMVMAMMVIVMTVITMMVMVITIIVMVEWKSPRAVKTQSPGESNQPKRQWNKQTLTKNANVDQECVKNMRAPKKGMTIVMRNVHWVEKNNHCLWPVGGVGFSVFPWEGVIGKLRGVPDKYFFI